MGKSRLEWKVGLFVAAGLLLLALLLLQFSKGTSIFEQKYSILLRAPNVGGLKMRAQVLMAGVQVGSVSDIKLSPAGTNVTITLRILNAFEIHKDARFLLEQSGFLGDQYVAIMPTRNGGPVFRDNETAVAEAPFDMQEVARSAGGFLRRIDVTATRLNESIADIRRLVLNEQTLTNLSTAVSNMRIVSERAMATVDNIDALVASNRPAIAQSGSNLVTFSEQLNEFALGLSAILATNRGEIHSTVKNLETSSEVLKNLLQDAQTGKGLAGNVLKNEQLAVSVSNIVNNLSITTSNLNRLGLWGILWQRKPPRTTAETPLVAPKTRD